MKVYASMKLVAAICLDGKQALRSLSPTQNV